MNEIAVIIPTYKAHKTIKQTLCSLATQFGVKYKVYIVVDGEELGSYDYLLDQFSFIDISILYKPTNSGAGMTRQYGIDHTEEPFITFIDADDVLMNANSLHTMYSSFKDNDVLVITPFYQELPDGQFRIRASSCLTWLHGKMYRRSFLDKYKVHFLAEYSNSNEDAGFNSMIGLIADTTTERIKLLDTNAVTYVQLRNINSITNQNDREFSRTIKNVEGFVYNKLHAFDYVVNNLKIMDRGIAESAVRSMCHIYINYVDINKDVVGYQESVDKLAKMSYNQLVEYQKDLTNEEIELIEKDLIQECGYAYFVYKNWKNKIIGGTENEN